MMSFWRRLRAVFGPSLAQLARRTWLAPAVDEELLAVRDQFHREICEIFAIRWKP